MDLSRIKKIEFPENQYYKQEFKKNQIYLHHTVSGDGEAGDVNTWKSNPERVATCVIIERNGDIIQLFSSKYWAHHLGVTSQVLQRMGYPLGRNLELNQGSIGIEIDSWGGLVKDVDGKFFPAKWDMTIKKFVPNKACKEIPAVNVIEYPSGFRGFSAFEKYTDAQIASVKDLICYWSDLYKIPTLYNPDIFDVTKRCFDKEAGIFSHVSCRSDKSDCHRQPELINMLQAL